MSGATTRSKERKLKGQRDLWNVIVTNTEYICFGHILPKLNRSDVKFLYGVNRETRALIKRSFRKYDVRMPFNIDEMSSLSTLDFFWKNRSFWPSDWQQRAALFSWKVAERNNLKLLKWAREKKKCEWDEGTINVAAENDNLEMLKYCVANECPFNQYACGYAAKSGSLECLKYLLEEVQAPWEPSRTVGNAVKYGHLHILEYLFERKYTKYTKGTCKIAAEYGHLDCLKFLHETAKAPWDELAFLFARMNNHAECVQYLLDNDCPLPDGWRYEGGVLHTPSSHHPSSSSTHCASSSHCAKPPKRRRTLRAVK
jgi:hypothetical protein